MKIRGVAVASALAIGLSASAYSSTGGRMHPTQSRLLDLGALSGIAYYIVEPAGYRVVAVLHEGDKGAPVLVEAVLADGQSVILSTPNEVGTAPTTIQIVREADKVHLQRADYTN